MNASVGSGSAETVLVAALHQHCASCARCPSLRPQICTQLTISMTCRDR